ncbi:hypothetical protein FG386_001899 [Cryptosporidium ryanae]|uniref:uncharacterized protein n=1 Tax=Cryptosporidium ryanae TaxID=515981 RepID=UPI00351A86EF|nr:hypothetical protein FG386_001899 [Cryptosporidium ryanae]
MTSIFKYSLNKNLDHVNTLVNLINNLRPFCGNKFDEGVDAKNDYLSVFCDNLSIDPEKSMDKGINNVNLTDKNTIEKNKLDSDWNMKVLNMISELCPGVFSKAMSLIDNGTIYVFIEINTNRRFYIVENMNKTGELSYLVMRHFCTCSSYINKVVIQKSDFTCKHELACSIIDAIYISNINNNRENDNKNFLILKNKSIRVVILNEYEYSEKYLDYISNFLIDNGTFRNCF